MSVTNSVKSKEEDTNNFATLVIFCSNYDNVESSEKEHFIHCCDRTDAIKIAIKVIKNSSGFKHHWMSIIRPTKVELDYSEPTIKKVV